MKIVIEGWRNFTHSFAMVNQYQILELLQRPEIQLYHHDIPLSFGRQNSATQGAGFDFRDNWLINYLSIEPPSDIDAVYRSHSPYNLLSLDRGQLLIFMVTEFGLDITEFGFNDANSPEFNKIRDNFHASGGKICTPSEWARQRIIHFGFHPDHVKVIPHGAHPKYFYPLTPVQRSTQRKLLGFQPNEIVFLNVGVSTWNKGIDILLIAFAHARQARNDLRLILKDQRNIYNINADQFIIDVLKKDNLLSNEVLQSITVIPRNLSLEQLRRLYGAVDYYISPYRAEGFNLPVIEAMACGTRVIVTHGGSTDEFIVPELATTIPSQKFEQTKVRDVIADAFLQPDVNALTEILLNITPWQLPPDFAVPIFPWRQPMDKLLNLIPQIQNKYPRPRSIHIYCDGGLGNRFNTLIAGYILAEKAGLYPIVVWPINNWCGANYDSLFEHGPMVLNRELITYPPEQENFQFLMTEDHLKMGVDYLSPLDLATAAEILNYLQSSSKDVFFHSPLIPTCLDHDSILHQVQRIPWKINLLRRAQDFIQENNLTNFFGIHIRKTDFGENSADDKNLYSLIQNNPTQHFFVCSDNQEVEENFRRLPNVVIYPKQSYVTKRITGDWNALTADHSGRIYPCNVERSAQSVIDAVVDLLILARSQIIQTSHSTFLMTAMLLKNTFPQSPEQAIHQNDISIPSEVISDAPPPLLPVLEVITKLGLPLPTGVLKIGVNSENDLPYFLKNGVNYGLFVESNVRKFNHLAKMCHKIANYVAINILCADVTGKKFILEYAGTHQEITSTTVDDLNLFLIQKGYNEIIEKLEMMYLSVRGGELSILKEAQRMLKQIKYLLIEMNLSSSQSSFAQLCCFLEVLGFFPRHLVTQNHSLVLFVKIPINMEKTSTISSGMA